MAPANTGRMAAFWLREQRTSLHLQQHEDVLNVAVSHTVAATCAQGFFCGQATSRPGVVVSVTGGNSFTFSRLSEVVHMQLVLRCTHSVAL